MKNTEGRLNLFEFEILRQVPDLKHFVTSRSGGVSLTPYDSLNLGMHTADNQQHVLENRALLASETGIATDRFLYASQVHSGDVKIIDEEAIANGVLLQNPQTDATITNLPRICLMVMVADCVPVLLFDPVKRVSAVVHAGWRGTIHQITRNSVNKMIDRFGCDTKDIIAGIGPSIGPCCYEVGEEIKAVVHESFGTTEGYLVSQPHSEKPYFDLWYANQKQLTDLGVKPENIEASQICTKCNHQMFYSSRADKGVTGRFAAGIFMVGGV